MTKSKLFRTLFPKRTSFVVNKVFQDLTIPFKVLEKFTKDYKKSYDQSNKKCSL